MDFDGTAIAVAIIGAVGLGITGWFSYKAATRVKTSNGHTSGELLEFIAEEIAWLRITTVEHVADLEMHRIDAAKKAAKHDAESTQHIEGEQ